MGCNSPQLHIPGQQLIEDFIVPGIQNITIGLRITPDDEIMGLDLSQHGEEGYNM